MVSSVLNMCVCVCMCVCVHVCVCWVSERGMERPVIHSISGAVFTLVLDQLLF